MNEVRVGKLPIIASYTCNLFENYFKGAKYDDVLLNCTKIPLICVGSRDCEQISKLESVLQAKRKKVKCYVTLIKWEPLHLTLNNSKSKEGWSDYYDKIENCSRQGEFELSYVKFAQEGVLRVLWFMKCL